MSNQQRTPAEKIATRVIFRLSVLILYGMASGIVVSTIAAPAVLGVGKPAYFWLGAVFSFLWLLLIGVRKVISGPMLIFLHRQFVAIDEELEKEIQEEAHAMLQEKFRRDLNEGDAPMAERTARLGEMNAGTLYYTLNPDEACAATYGVIQELLINGYRLLKPLHDDEVCPRIMVDEFVLTSRRSDALFACRIYAAIADWLFTVRQLSVVADTVYQLPSRIRFTGPDSGSITAVVMPASMTGSSAMQAIYPGYRIVNEPRATTWESEVYLNQQETGSPYGKAPQA